MRASFWRNLFEDERGFIGTTAAIIGGLIAAGGSVAAAGIGAHAAGKAADQQVAAGNQALAVQQQQYQHGLQIMSPYLQGGNAFANLGGRVTNQPMTGAAPTSPSPTTVGALSSFGQGRPPTMTGPLSGQPDLVTVQAPTGETRQMPRQQAQPYLARGAQIVG